MTPFPRSALLLSSLLCLCAPAMAAVRLPAILSDHMVLQRDAHVPVWGWAAPGEPVSVAFGKQTARTSATADGRWKVELDLRAASATPAALTVRGAADQVVVNDVLVGEVWLGSGQSNMEKPLGEQRGQKPTFNAEAEIAAANYPQLRLFKVARKKATQAADDVGGSWVVCSPATLDATKFSAAAYFFGRRLQQELHAPVGMIESSWGGTRIELWTPDAPASAMDPEAARLYNGMIAGLGPFALKGLLWYQGESNINDSDDPALYPYKMETMIKRWRAQWQRELPFYYVQLAPHFYHLIRRDKAIGADALPRMWEAQADALRIPATGMIVTTDLADDLYDIHPRDKRSVGIRLADLALNQTYQRKDIAASGPVFRSLTIDGRQAVLSFDHAEGLAARDGKPLSWFDIAGADGVYSHADARIKDGQVILGSARVPAPVSVRFAWDEAAQPNLVNAAGLPARPFRSQRPPERFDVAVTVDDLPAHGQLPPGMTWLGIVNAHMDAFRAHGVVEAFGFVNASKLASNADGGAALDAWRSAGHPLGNHTFTHMNIARAPSLAAWQADVESGEPAVAERMQGQDWHWLRFPYLSVGDHPEAAMAYLKGRGYRVADVSLGFSDWAYTDAYARCVAKGDGAAIAAMKAHYLDAVDDGIARMKQNSKRIYGRIIPQVLLTHAGGWSAVTLPEVLARLDAAGAHYVTLAQAQSDPAYAEPGGGDMMQRTAGKLKIELVPETPPRVKLNPETLCR